MLVYKLWRERRETKTITSSASKRSGDGPWYFPAGSSGTRSSSGFAASALLTRWLFSTFRRGLVRAASFPRGLWWGYYSVPLQVPTWIMEAVYVRWVDQWDSELLIDLPFGIRLAVFSQVYVSFLWTSLVALLGCFTTSSSWVRWTPSTSSRHEQQVMAELVHHASSLSFQLFFGRP